MATPKPFKINVPDVALDILKSKLSTIRLPATVPDGWTQEQGVPEDRMTRVLHHWKNSYLPRWREREAALNEAPTYTIPVDVGDFGSLNIHFVWKKSTRTGAVPLLFIHGWPGCYLEGKKIWDTLSEGDENSPAFDIIVPSLPNFGFSDGVGKKGFHLGLYATAMHNLMTSLGYTQYVIQGGDWGSMISRQQARQYPKSVKAVHINFAGVNWYNLLTSPMSMAKFLTWRWLPQERKGLARGKQYLSGGAYGGSGYYQEQSSRPLTVAYCLADSPVALLGWVWEKLIIWSQNPDKAWSDDELLDWISVYWFSKAGPGAAHHIYHEAEVGMDKIGSYWEYQPAPLGITQFPFDLVGMPAAFLRTLGNVVFERWADRGGHFAAWEAPDELIKDLRTMFGKGGPAYAVVAGKDGYAEAKPI